MLTDMTASLTQIVASGVRAEMARQGKTQQQVSELAGMAQQTLSRRLKLDDPTPFDIDELERVARALAVSPTSFFALATSVAAA
jgi:transcriptional regulator with XRE-family HTH domain